MSDITESNSTPQEEASDEAQYSEQGQLDFGTVTSDETVEHSAAEVAAEDHSETEDHSAADEHSAAEDHSAAEESADEHADAGVVDEHSEAEVAAEEHSEAEAEVSYEEYDEYEEEVETYDAQVTIVYHGPTAPHWDFRSDYGEVEIVEAFKLRVQARLLLLPPHDPQFRRNRERVNRDAESSNISLAWDLGYEEETTD